MRIHANSGKVLHIHPSATSILPYKYQGSPAIAESASQLGLGYEEYQLMKMLIQITGMEEMASAFLNQVR